MKPGDLVKWIDSADENSPGWAEDTAGSLGIVIEGCETLGYSRTGELSKHWFWVQFPKVRRRVFYKDFEVIS